MNRRNFLLSIPGAAIAAKLWAEEGHRLITIEVLTVRQVLLEESVTAKDTERVLAGLLNETITIECDYAGEIEL